MELLFPFIQCGVLVLCFLVWRRIGRIDAAARPISLTVGVWILALGIGIQVVDYGYSRLALAPLLGSGIWIAGIALVTWGIIPWVRWAESERTELQTAVRDRTKQLSATLEELKRQKNKSNYLSAHDPLTGFGNRTALTERLRELLDLCSRTDASKLFAVLFVDLDRFKFVNDTLGHEAGDQVLRTVAGRLSATVRSSDYVYRQGGDEFVIISTNLRNEIDAARVAEKIRAEIRRPYHLADATITIGISIGIAVYPKDGDDAPTLIRHADLAMYEAKRSHGGHRFFKKTLNQYAFERLNVERDLGVAITSNQLRLEYQPIVDNHGALVAVEALARWDHPTRGVVMPSSFIPIAEETGQIVPFGRLVLQRAVADLALWQGSTLQPLSVAVNISIEQLEQAYFAMELEQMCANQGVQTSDVMLEITETGAATHEALVRRRIDELRELGFLVALDDFGVGHSSLALLRQLPVNYVKLDRSFVNGHLPDGEPLDAPRMATDLVAGVIQILDHLGKITIIEGIETVEQACQVQQFENAFRQGFFYGRPVPFHEIETVVSGTA